MQSNEEQLIAAGRGKWSQAGVPHKGWTCVDIEDLGERDLLCQMCESTTVRFVHLMHHEAYPETLSVGCVCAGHMEGDVAAARGREASMQSRAAKRKRWLTRNWRVSARGNPWIRSDGYRVVVYAKGGGWGATVTSEVNDATIHSRRFYPSKSEVQLAAFDAITKLLARGA